MLEEDLGALPYGQRLAALARHHVGLWDAVASATRTGSLDAAIRDVAANPLGDLAASLPHLRAVACNGQASHRIASRELAAFALPVIALPSSSPAYAAMPWAEKRARWLELRKFL